MRDYGKVHSAFWSSPTFATASDDGKLLAVYTMTCTHNTITGVFRLPDGYAAEDLGWSIDRVAKGFSELSANGFINRCETTKWVWVVKHLAWNPLDNPNQRKAAAKIAATIPAECSWKQAFMLTCAPLLGMPSQPMSNGSTTVAQPSRNQEQEQEQERKKEQEKASPKSQRARTVAKKTAMPADFTVSARVAAWATTKGFDSLDLHLEVFQAKCAANGYTYADWDSAFMEAVRADWAKLRGEPGRGTVAKISNALHADDVIRATA